jgi:hypothetical protein
MNKGSILLNIIAKDYTLIRKGNYYTTEEHDSLVIDPQKGTFYWNSKGIFGNEVDYLIKVKGFSYPQATHYLTTIDDDFNFQVYEVQPETPNPALVDIFYEYGKDYQDYWKEYRGYTEDTINKFKLGYTGKYWVIPIYSNHQFINFQCRGWDVNGNKIVRSYYKGLGSLPFNFGYLPTNYEQPIVITESIVDAIMLDQQGIFAVSHNSGAMSWNHEWSKSLFNYATVYIVYDNDEAGLNGACRTSQMLQHNSYILKWPDGFKEKFDITDLYKNGYSWLDIQEHFIPSYILKCK